MFTTDDTPIHQIDALGDASWLAWLTYRKVPVRQRANLLRAIATELDLVGDELLRVTMEETHLPEARLRNERARTIFQLNSYAAACEQGDWLEVRIDTADPARNPPKPDIRKMLVPLGPVVVFGSSNFPYAYSTAGGDTACALAAGCTVIVKAHPAHPRTSGLVAEAIRKAVQHSGLPEDIFIHVYGAGTATGEALVKHPRVRALGFTGSYSGGRALFDWAAQRREPIPVFAEMGSVNPVFLLPDQLNATADEQAAQLAASIMLGVGQFCTNPGLIIGVAGSALDRFTEGLAKRMQDAENGTMLHAGIATAYAEKRRQALEEKAVRLMTPPKSDPGPLQGQATLATVAGKDFIASPRLHQEVFGPYSLVVQCADVSEMQHIAATLEGQLTATVMGSEADLEAHDDLISLISDRCGRLILNGVPTGVEVCLAMQHGGPFPASTDARFTSVGADGIRRFARPLAYQNWSEAQLPDELKSHNPLSIWRTVNNQLTRDPL